MSVVAFVAVRTSLTLVKELARLGFELRTRPAMAVALMGTTINPGPGSRLESRGSSALIGASSRHLDASSLRRWMTALRLVLIFRASRPPLIVILGVGLLSLLSKLALTLAIVRLLDL